MPIPDSGRKPCTHHQYVPDSYFWDGALLRIVALDIIDYFLVMNKDTSSVYVASRVGRLHSWQTRVPFPCLSPARDDRTVQAAISDEGNLQAIILEEWLDCVHAANTSSIGLGDL